MESLSFASDTCYGSVSKHSSSLNAFNGEVESFSSTAVNCDGTNCTTLGWNNCLVKQPSLVVGLTLLLAVLAVIPKITPTYGSFESIKEAFPLEISRSNTRDAFEVKNLLYMSLEVTETKPVSLCSCPSYDGNFNFDDHQNYCKSLLLLRHAKSSWKNSFFVNDIDRHLSHKGIKVAHTVGKLLNHMNVQLPDLILSSPSIRTEETLNIVLDKWVLGEESKGKLYKKIGSIFKLRSKDEHKKLIKKLEEKDVRIEYNDAWYGLSDEGYLDYLINVLSHASIGDNHDEPQRVMLVGHNPAMERLLNDLSPLKIDSKDSAHWHYSPGQFYEICFPTLTSWGELKQDTRTQQHTGDVVLMLPLQK